MNTILKLVIVATLIAGILPTVLVTAVHAQNQTDTVSPIDLSGPTDYHISLHEYDFGGADIPGLHSFASGIVDGKWVILSGRTNGIHDINQAGTGSFPAESENRDVWVIDPVAKQSWHRSLGDPTGRGFDPNSGLSPYQIVSLSATNNEFEQVGNTLYVAGGYGLNTSGQFETFNQLAAIDLPGLANWVITGSGKASTSIRQINSAVTSVTGGEMYLMNGRTNLVFGQDFDGPYSPRSDGAYTRQVRSFNIVDNGVSLSISGVTQTTPADDYRRRDLNVFPTVHPNGLGGFDEGLVALSGVFTNTFGAWTVPVVVDGQGNPSMADRAAESTFKQGFNNYHSAKLGLYSESENQMSEVLFGGISFQTLDPTSGQVITDSNLPFVNDITAIKIDSQGAFSQQHLGFFPTIEDADGNAWRFGTNAEFFPAPGLPTFPNGVIRTDQLTGPTVLGYIFGGIMSNAPNTRGVPGAVSAASFRIFEVDYAPVPEPSSICMLALGGLACLDRSGWIRQTDGTEIRGRWHRESWRGRGLDA